MNRSRLLLPVLALAGAGIYVVAPVQAGGRPLSAQLDAKNEVSPAVGEPGATGSASITLNQGRGEICFDLDLDLDEAPTLAHIHVGAAGKNGGVVVDFFENGVVTEGCVAADESLIKEIRKDPAGYYVNVHTKTAFRGAVRGQLAP